MVVNFQKNSGFNSGCQWFKQISGIHLSFLLQRLKKKKAEARLCLFKGLNPRVGEYLCHKIRLTVYYSVKVSSHLSDMYWLQQICLKSLYTLVPPCDELVICIWLAHGGQGSTAHSYFQPRCYMWGTHGLELNGCIFVTHCWFPTWGEISNSIVWPLESRMTSDGKLAESYLLDCIPTCGPARGGCSWWHVGGRSKLEFIHHFQSTILSYNMPFLHGFSFLPFRPTPATALPFFIASNSLLL